jgi:CYTH domain-containing protein
MIDYKQTTAPKTTITRDMNELTEKVGNVYETVAILGKRSNQISTAMKKELDAKLQDFSIPQESADETFEKPDFIGREVTDDNRYYNSVIGSSDELPPIV